MPFNPMLQTKQYIKKKMQIKKARKYQKLGPEKNLEEYTKPVHVN